MRTPTIHGRREVRSDQAMTPMIDVVFLLLIFFVCASIGQVQEGLLPTELSAGSVESIQPVEPRVDERQYWLYLKRTPDARTVFEINNSRYDDFASLRPVLEGLAELAAGDPMILDIEGEVPVGDLIQVYDACRTAGFSAIHFATQRPDGNGQGARTTDD